MHTKGTSHRSTPPPDPVAKSRIDGYCSTGMVSIRKPLPMGLLTRTSSPVGGKQGKGG